MRIEDYEIEIFLSERGGDTPYFGLQSARWATIFPLGTRKIVMTLSQLEEFIIRAQSYAELIRANHDRILEEQKLSDNELIATRPGAYNIGKS